MKGPVGISVDYEENIYVTSFISNNVHQLTPDGQLNRILLNKDDGIREPRSICLQKYNNRFVVCDSAGVKLCQLLSSSMWRHENLYIIERSSIRDEFLMMQA